MDNHLIIYELKPFISEGNKNKMTVKRHYVYNPGDIVIESWEVKGNNIVVGMYLVYDKEYTQHCYDKDIGYTSYKCYVMFTHDPYGREDKSGLLNVGETYEITHWNDMDVLSPNFPGDWIKVVQSGLSWEDVD